MILPQPLQFTIGWSFKMRYCMSFYLNWNRNYVRSKLKACFLWHSVIPEPVEIEVHTVPNFKAPINAKVELRGLECGGIFSIQTSLLDISHLLHKTGFVKTESVGTVACLRSSRLSWTLVIYFINQLSDHSFQLKLQRMKKLKYL